MNKKIFPFSYWTQGFYQSISGPVITRPILGKLSILIPNMTSDSTPSGIVTSSTVYSSQFPAWQAFTGTNNLFGWGSNENALPQWIQYQFPTNTKVCPKVYFLCGWDFTPGQTTDSWIFQASNNGVNWVTLDTQTQIVAAANGAYFPIVNYNFYQYFRWTIKATNYVQPGFVQMNQLQMWGFI